jgi:hypothetical protein
MYKKINANLNKGSNQIILSTQCLGLVTVLIIFYKVGLVSRGAITMFGLGLLDKCPNEAPLGDSEDANQ